MQEEKIKSKVDTSTVLLMSFVVLVFVTNIGIVAIQKFVNDWYMNPVISVFVIGLSIIRNTSYILPALAIRHKRYKIIGVVLASIMVIWLLYSPIMAIIGVINQGYN